MFRGAAWKETKNSSTTPTKKDFSQSHNIIAWLARHMSRIHRVQTRNYYSWMFYNQWEQLDHKRPTAGVTNLHLLVIEHIPRKLIIEQICR